MPPSLLKCFVSGTLTCSAIYLTFALSTGELSAQQAGESIVKSPDGKVVFSFQAGDRVKWSVDWAGKSVVKDAALGISIDGNNLGVKARIVGTPQIQPVSDKFAVRGVHAMAATRCNAATIVLSGGEPEMTWNLEVRAYDDAVAYRYNVPGNGKRHVDGESTAWNLPANSVLFYLGAKNRSYEDRYRSKPVGEMETGFNLMAMATAELPDAGGYAMITEANVVNYSDLTLLAAGDDTLKAAFSNDPQGWTAESGGAVVSPWRVTLLASDLNRLVNSDVIRSLCPAPENSVANANYIKPGRSIWHWLTGGAPKFEEQHAWIDGTRQMGFEYYLVDDGWKKWNGGGEKAWEALTDVVRYGKSQNVALWTWVNGHEVFDPRKRDEYFQHARRIGLVGLKIDFPEAANSVWINWYDDVLRDAAKVGLMVDFHGAVKPSGRDRTWPNEMTREAIAGREQGKNPASHDTALPFTRYVQGNADYTPVLLDPAKLNGSSLAHELAMSIVYTSPFLCYGDNPKRYLESEAADVIKNTPSVWDETVVLPASRIGKLAAFARQRQGQWFVGVINGTDVHEEKVSLAFLGAGSYTLVELADASDTNAKFVRSERIVTRNDTLTAPLRKDGGYVAWLRPTSIGGGAGQH